MTARLPAILAVDGGNSKADVALVAADGSLLAAVRGPTISHQAVGLEAGLDTLERSVDQALVEAGQPRTRRPAAGLGVYTLAGADLRSDVRLLDRGLEARTITDDRVVLNDTVRAAAGGQRPTVGRRRRVRGRDERPRESVRAGGSSGSPRWARTRAIAAPAGVWRSRRSRPRSGAATDVGRGRPSSVSCRRRSGGRGRVT